eukprot:1159462-Pelagomonas_calceolata.AAC.7
MERPGLVLDTSNDVERVPGRYQTSEEWMEIVDRSVGAARQLLIVFMCRLGHNRMYQGCSVRRFEMKMR